MTEPHAPNSKERERIRANEQRRLEHAIGVLTELINKHSGDERELWEVHALQKKLEHAIKFQHSKIEYYKPAQPAELPQGGY